MAVSTALAATNDIKPTRAKLADDCGAGAGAFDDSGGVGERCGIGSHPGHFGATRAHLFRRVRRACRKQKEKVESTDELGQVRRKISQVGQQLRGVHEIFSSLRENMNSVMAGLEDGLILFTRDARAVMVSPAAEKFLGAPASNFLGRRVTDIFPPGHPLYEALRLEGDEFHEVASETEVETVEGKKRIGVTVQEIQGEGESMGALVTLRDLDSLESINTQLQVSERLAAVGRITAGVAHEVKNPLNSMRLWLENLKESLPPETDGAAQQAVHVLDAEIDRLDAVVKRFLDFSRPMEVRLEPTQLADVLKEVLEMARPQLQQTKVQVAQLIPIGVPEVFVDRALLKQAILNLVLNAVEAMPTWRAIAIDAEPAGRDGGDHGGRYRERNSAGEPAKSISIVFYDAARRKRNRIGEHVPNCAASQRFDRLHVGGWPRNDVPDRVAAGRVNMDRNSGPRTMERRKRIRAFLLAPVCLSLMVCGGCVMKKRPTPHLENLALAHPVIPARLGRDGAGEAPDLGLESAPMPGTLGGLRNPPARPKVAVVAHQPVAGKNQTSL